MEQKTTYLKSVTVFALSFQCIYLLTEDIEMHTIIIKNPELKQDVVFFSPWLPIYYPHAMWRSAKEVYLHCYPNFCPMIGKQVFRHKTVLTFGIVPKDVCI